MSIMQFQELKPGMVLDQDILNQSHIVILGEGTVLTQEHINSLERIDVDFVFIKDEVSAPKETTEVIKHKEEYRASAFDKAVSQMEKIHNQIKNDESLVYNEIFDCVKDLVKAFYGYDDVMDVLDNIKADRPYSLYHAPSVAVISVLLGKWLHLEHQKIYQLAMGAYLSHIGMFKVPEDILNAPRQLNFQELEMVKAHIQYSVDILTKSDGFSDEIISIVLQYHERCDGNGYPYMMDNVEISMLSKIVAVADVFHALLCDRPYRNAYNVFEATKIIWEMSFNELEITVAERLVKFMAAFWMGKKVQLSTGDVGEIVMINKYDYFKPLIRVGERFIDLSVQTDVTIVGEPV